MDLNVALDNILDFIKEHGLVVLIGIIFLCLAATFLAGCERKPVFISPPVFYSADAGDMTISTDTYKDCTEISCSSR